MSLRKLTADEKQAFALSNTLLARYINANLALTVPELHLKLRDCTCSALEAAILAILIKAIANGDDQALEALIQRVIGKVKTEVELHNKSKFDSMSTEELIRLKRDLDINNSQTIKQLELSTPKIKDYLDGKNGS